MQKHCPRVKYWLAGGAIGLNVRIRGREGAGTHFPDVSGHRLTYKQTLQTALEGENENVFSSNVNLRPI